MLHQIFQQILKPQIEATCQHIWVIHTNGARECRCCHRIEVPEEVSHAYEGPAYKGEEEDGESTH